MSFNSVVQTFTTLLNRDDMTAAQGAIFVQQAMNRVQREVRLPCMERVQLITAQATISRFAVPSDLIQLQDIFVPDQAGILRPMVKKSYREVVQMDPLLWPFFYARWQNLFYVAGAIGIGTTLQVNYWGEFTPITDPTQDNELTATEPDMIVYAALGYAGDYFEHPNTDRWEAKYQGLRDSINMMASDLENSGGPASVQQMYSNAWECS